MLEMKQFLVKMTLVSDFNVHHVYFLRTVGFFGSVENSDHTNI